jgi:ribosome maturation factor RimP
VFVELKREGDKMNFETVQNKIEEWLKPELAECNLYLVDVKFSMGKQIDVYLESDTGVQISECAIISRRLEKYLDESGLVPENYILEVSSPGMTNPLKVPRQYKRRIGQRLEVLLMNGSVIEGELLSADDQKITLNETPEQTSVKGKKIKVKENKEQKEHVVGFEEIKRAMLKFKF